MLKAEQRFFVLLVSSNQLSLLAVFGAKRGQAALIWRGHQFWKYSKQLGAGGWGNGFDRLRAGMQALAGRTIGKYHLMLIK